MKNPLITFYFLAISPNQNQLMLAICAAERNLNYVRQSGFHSRGLIA